MKKLITTTLIVGLLAGFSVLGMAATSTSSFDATVNETISITAPTVTNMTVHVGSTANSEGQTNTVSYLTTYTSNEITAEVMDATPGNDIPTNPVSGLDVNIKGGLLGTYNTLVSGESSQGPLTLKSGISADNTSFGVSFQLDAGNADATDTDIGSPGTYIVTFTITSTE